VCCSGEADKAVWLHIFKVANIFEEDFGAMNPIKGRRKVKDTVNFVDRYLTYAISAGTGVGRFNRQRTSFALFFSSEF
jgi:hypothetical protein